MVRATSSSNIPKQGFIEYLRGIASRNKDRKPEKENALVRLFAHQDVLSEQLANKQAEANAATQQLSQLRSELQSARNTVDGYRLRVSKEESGLSDFKDPNSKHQLESARAELNRAIANLEAEEEHLDSLRRKIEGLRREIQSCGHGAEIGDVKAYLAALAEQRTLIAHLDELVRNVEASPASDDVDAEELSAFQRAREELLADIAAGLAKPEDLEALDARAEGFLNESAGRQTEAQNAARNHQQTLAGLTRRLSVAQARYDELAGRMPQVIEQLLIAQAAAAYEQYKAAAETLMASFQHLQGLQEVLSASVPHSKVRLLSPQWAGLFIPSVSDFVATNQGSDCLYGGQAACQINALQEAHRQALVGLAEEGLAELFEQGCKA